MLFYWLANKFLLNKFLVVVLAPLYLSFLNAWARLTTVGSQISVNTDGIWANVFSNHLTALPYLKCSENCWLRLQDWPFENVGDKQNIKSMERTLSYDMKQLRVHYKQVDLKGILPLLAWKTGPRVEINQRQIIY